jgi:trimeric autotransporter adhesin
MSRARRALVPVVALASLLLQASTAAATLAPAPASPWATANGRVLAIVRVNNVVYVGGKFTQMVDTNGTVLARNHLAAVSAIDGHVLPWNPGANNTVRSMAVSVDGKTVYIGGDFTSLGGKARAHAAAMAAIAPTDPTTTGTVRPWVANTDGIVYAVTQIGPRVYLGGAFLHVGGHGRPRLASVSAATGALTSWHPKVDGAVRALLPAAGGSTLFIGGSFHHVNKADVAHLASIDPVKNRLHPWRSHTRDTILAFAENGKYLYAGDRGGGGHVRSFVLSTGKLRWTETTNGNVNTVALVGSGASQQLVLGGHFTKVGSQVRHKVAIISPITGLVDRSPGAWHPAAAGSDLGVYSELAYGQHIYFGGDFLEWQTHPGVVEQDHLAVFSTTAAADATPPVVTPPVPTIPNGATIGVSKVPLRLTWKATDAASGVCRSTVARRFAGNPFAAVPLTLATVRSATTQAAPAAKAYLFSASATDCSDLVSATATSAPVHLAAYQNSSPAIVYRGGWSPLRARSAYGGSVRRTSRAGATATLRFTGREIAWVASKTPASGSARVLIDGKSVAIVHLRATASAQRQVVFTRTWATAGTHTIRIVGLGTRSHPQVSLDALLVLR